MSESGLMRSGGVVVLSGPALKAARDCALIAARHRKSCGVPFRTYEALACELSAAMSAAGQSDVRAPAISKAVAVEQPAMPLDKAAVRLGISVRHARRLALRLGGRKITGRWFVDETALNEHIGGKRK